MHIDAARLRRDITENAQFGSTDAVEGWGRTVPTGSDADKKARDRLVAELESIGVEVRVDAVGNIAGRWTPPSCDPEAAPVGVGSHLDSVPNGGIFDGPLGTYAAVEAVRSLQESAEAPARPIEVVCFTGEEGSRFGIGTLGSSVAAGQRQAAEALALEDENGITLQDCLERIGFAGSEAIDASEWDTWVELHIEQGTRLTAAGAGVGIVESIVGITNCEVTVTGEADHAGSTPMFDRSDALAAAAAFILDLESAAEEIATESDAAVGTAGEGSISPNARNIVPEKVQLQLDIRDVTHETMDRLVDRCRSSLARIERRRAVETSLARYRDSTPSQMSDRCITAAEGAAEDHSTDAIRLHSAAMHDTANVAAVTDAGLLFAPSKDGVSHSPREWTDWDDCAVATEVLAETVRSLAAT
jgi:N-carbamoyl-L-amino-acid hydrolase